MNTKNSILTFLETYNQFIADDEHLYQYDHSFPLLFEDEISEILDSVPDESVIECFEANEIAGIFHSNHSGFTDNTGKIVSKKELISIIYNLLEKDIGSVFINNKFITDF